MKTDVRALIQTALDAEFNTPQSADKIRVFWLRRNETTGEDPDEYIVYTVDTDPYEDYADNEPFTRAARLTVRYYYRDILLDTAAGRAQIKGREASIESALRAAGFALPSGYFDGGDIDDIGFGTTIFPVEYWEVL